MEKNNKISLIEILLKTIKFEKIDEIYLIDELELFLEKLLKILYDIVKAKTIAIALYDEEQDVFHVKKIYKREEYRNYFGNIYLPEFNIESYKFCKLEKHEELNENKDFENLRAKEIVYLNGDKITGFITFSEIDDDLKNKINSLDFQFIETLIKIISNNEEIINQFDLMEKKLMNISTLYDLISNVQISKNIELLFENLLSTISIVYRMTECMILRRVDNHLYEVMECIGTMEKDSFMEMKPDLILNLDTIIYDYTYLNFQNYFETKKIDGDSNCLIIAPIDIKILGIEKNVIPEYYLVITNIEDGLKIENVQAIELITKMISSIYKKYKIDNYVQDNNVLECGFLEDLSEKIDDYSQFGIEFYLTYKKVKINPFSKINDDICKDECYIVENYAFYLGFDPNYGENFISIEGIEKIEDFLNYELK